MSGIAVLPTLDELHSDSAHWFFGRSPVERIFRTAAIIGAHVEKPGALLGRLEEVQFEFGELASAIERMNECGPRTDGSVRYRPKVHFVIELTSKGNLRVSYCPENPAEFGQSRYQYGYHAGGRPVNELLFFRDFDRIWDDFEAFRPAEVLDRIIAREIMKTAVGVIEEAERQVGLYCEILTAWKFEKSDDAPSGYRLLSPGDLAEREERQKEAERLDVVRAADEVRRAKAAEVSGWKSAYRMEPTRILGLLDALRTVRIPMAGCVEIMVLKFGLERPDDVAKFEGITRSMRNRIAALGLVPDDVGVSPDDARALAREFLGAVRKPWRPARTEDNPVAGKIRKRRLPYTDYASRPRKRKPLEG